MQSFINPNVINKNAGSNPGAFSAFMTGRREPLGNSIPQFAQNKIVNFNRGSVRPLSNNVPDVINNISNNINTTNNFSNITQKISQNVNNSVTSTINRLQTQNQSTFTSIQKQIKNTLDSLIGNFQKDYQQKLQNIESNKPLNVLKKFLSVYQNAIDFVSFFSNERNIKTIRTSLKTLRRVFDETFEVASVIRKTIIRIVRQLSNLPTATGNGSDLNLDLNVPGGPLKQTGTRNFGGSKFAKAGMIAATAGLGIGAVGLGSQMMNKAQQFQEEKLRSTVRGDESNQQIVPEDLLDGLGRIINNFSNAVTSLLDFAKKRQSESSTSGSSSAAPPPPPPDSSGAPGESGAPGTMGTVGEMISSGATASWYDPSLGGINTSGIKTREGLPSTSTGEGFRKELFTAAAFPNLLSRLPSSMTSASSGNPSGRTLGSGQAFNVLVVDEKTGKQAIIRVNDVGSGVSGQPSSRLLDLSPAARDYFGGASGTFKVYMAGPDSKPGPISSTSAASIINKSNVSQSQSQSSLDSNQNTTFTASIQGASSQSRVTPASPNTTNGATQNLQSSAVAPSQTQIASLPLQVISMPPLMNAPQPQAPTHAEPSGLSAKSEIAFLSSSNSEDPFKFNRLLYGISVSA